DVVAQITGIIMQETVPDSVFDRADEVELIDLTAEQLRKRIDEGKVYLAENAGGAADNFFREGNLKALREIALRLTAEKADRQLLDFLKDRSIKEPWRSRERLLVAIGPSPYSERLIRWTRRIAAATHATWMGIYVESSVALDEENKQRLSKNLTLARSLGAEVLMTSGDNIAEALLRMAQEHNATQIVVGKPMGNRFIEMLRGGSLVDRLVRKSGEIDIYVVRADNKPAPWRPQFGAWSNNVSRLGDCIKAIAAVFIVTLLGLLLKPLVGYTTVGLLYLFSVLIMALCLRRGPMVLMALLSALTWNFLFIEPKFTFYVSNVHDGVLLGAYFLVAIIVGQLTSRLRRREFLERQREQQATALYQFARELVSAESLQTALRNATRLIDGTFQCRTSVFLKAEKNSLTPVAASGPALDEHELSVATWAFLNKEAAGRFTNTLPQSAIFCTPLRSRDHTLGVVALRFNPDVTFGLNDQQLFETFCAQIAVLIERDSLRHKATQFEIEENSQRLQKTLLDCVSHELKTPLAVITTAAESLEKSFSPGSLLSEIRIAASRLNRIVSNLLNLARIEAGTVKTSLDWWDLREIVAQVLDLEKTSLLERDVEVVFPNPSGPFELDAALIEQILANLLRNAARHSTHKIKLHLSFENSQLQICVSDDGPGIAPEEITHIFDKFYRGSSTKTDGLGLGLSIIKGFAEAHHGSVSVQNINPRGSEFLVHIPSRLSEHPLL
ncbi:MAG: ATP-binding protein, partial [Chthoniobacterales bacterium]